MSRSGCIAACGDAGFVDSYRGWYDVQGCGQCNDYCRWVGNDGSGGDPTKSVRRKTSWWSCRKAGTNQTYTNFDMKNDTRYYGREWKSDLKKCDGGRGATAARSEWREDARARRHRPTPGVPRTKHRVTT